jgi:hypothetical protein
VDQDNCWEEIRNRLNAQFGEQRDVASIKKKWSQVKSEAKPTLAKYRQSLRATGDVLHSMLSVAMIDILNYMFIFSSMYMHVSQDHHQNGHC